MDPLADGDVRARSVRSRHALRRAMVASTARSARRSSVVMDPHRHWLRDRVLVIQARA